MFSMKLQLNKYTGSLSDKIYFAIKEAILRGDLSPGYRLLVLDIANSLNISQAPVREAMERLKQEGLLVSKPYRGSVVSDISKEEIEEIYALRELIEGYAIRNSLPILTEEHIQELHDLYAEMKRAAENDDLYSLILKDMEFHGLFYKLCGNKTILNVWNQMNTKIRRFLAITNKVYFPSLVDVADSHIPLLEVLKTRDVDQVEQEFIKHMKEVWWRMKK